MKPENEPDPSKAATERWIDWFLKSHAATYRNEHYGTDIGAVLNFDVPFTNREEVFRILLDRGIRITGPRDLDGSGLLWRAIDAQETGIIRILLDRGVDPNGLEPGADDQTLYDFAEWKYRFETYSVRERNSAWGEIDMPEESSKDDSSSEDKWLLYLDRLARKYGTRPPDYLFLLRERGARTYAELHPVSGRVDSPETDLPG